MLYEMLAGDPPHTGANVQAVIAKLLTERPTSLRVLRDTVPHGVDQAVAKALAKTPADRFANVPAFVAALTAGAGDPTKAARRPAARWLVASGILVVLATAAVAGTRMLSPRIAPPLAESRRTQVTFSGRADRPVLSPDGAQLAYTYQQCDGNGSCRHSIIVHDVATSVERSLMDVGPEYVATERWSRSGSWLLIEGAPPGTLGGSYAVSHLGGPLLWLGLGHADFLPGGDTALVAAHFISTSTVYLRLIPLPAAEPVDSTALGAPRGASALTDLRVSPTGRGIAVTWYRDKLLPLLALYDRAGRLLDTASGRSNQLHWNGDGTALLASVRTEDRQSEALLRIRVAAGHFDRRDTLVIGPSDAGWESYDLSADGQTLAYTSYRSGEHTLWSLERSAAGAPRPLRRVHESTQGIAGYIAKDGQTIFYGIPQESDAHSVYRVYATPFDSGAGRAVTPPLVDVWYWNPTQDGRRFVVVNPASGGKGRLTAYDVATGRASPMGELPSFKDNIWEAGTNGVVGISATRDTLFVLDGNGVQRRQIVLPDSLGLANGEFTVSSDGTGIAFVTDPPIEFGDDGNREYRVYRASLVTGAIQQVTRFRALGLGLPFGWTTDGWIHISFTTNTDEAGSLYRVRAAGGTLERESPLPFAPDHCDCTMSGDGRRWVGDVAHNTSDVYLIRNFQLLRSDFQPRTP